MVCWFCLFVCLFVCSFRRPSKLMKIGLNREFIMRWKSLILSVSLWRERYVSLASLSFSLFSNEICLFPMGMIYVSYLLCLTSHFFAAAVVTADVIVVDDILAATATATDVYHQISSIQLTTQKRMYVCILNSEENDCNTYIYFSIESEKEFNQD